MRKPATGFTLIETMIVIAITAILAAIAVPQFQDFIARRAIAAQVSSLASSFRLARAEAIKRGVPVSVCRSDAPEAADPDCSAGAPALGWGTGWIVFVDRPAFGTREADDVVIKVQPPIDTTGGIDIDGAVPYVLTFQPSGIALGAARGFTLNPKLDPAHPSYATLRQFMCVDATGRTRLTTNHLPCP